MSAEGRLVGKVAIVTGAGQGIGLGYAERFLAEGAKVVVAELSEERAASAMTTLAGKGEAEFVRTDISDPDSAQACADATVERFGTIDILINNAALYHDIDNTDASYEYLQKVFSVNQHGAWIMSRAVAPVMVAHQFGRIINQSSGAAYAYMFPPMGEFSGLGNFSYSITKWGIVGLTKFMAAQLGQYGITVNCIAPGVTMTDATKKVVPEAFLEGMTMMTAMKQRLEPEDLAGAAVFFASDDARLCTGQTLVIDGGLAMPAEVRTRLEGKVALITGAAQGQGEAEARRFAAEGARVVVADVLEDQARAVAREIGAAALYAPLDVTDPDRWAVVVGAAISAFGRLDILVNNAGIAVPPTLLDEVSIHDHHRILAVNLDGVFLGMRAVVAAMSQAITRDSGGGSIVNISSIDGIVGVAGMASYSASKFAVTGLTRTAALELGRFGIRVNSIHPGVISSPMVAGAPPAVRDRIDRLMAQQPIPRMGTPEEVANLALFLASDESSYCTGAQFVIDGGHLAGPYREGLWE